MSFPLFFEFMLYSSKQSNENLGRWVSTGYYIAQLGNVITEVRSRNISATTSRTLDSGVKGSCAIA
jgi:hypothetical protein